MPRNWENYSNCAFGRLWYNFDYSLFIIWIVMTENVIKRGNSLKYSLSQPNKPECQTTWAFVSALGKYISSLLFPATERAEQHRKQVSPVDFKGCRCYREVLITGWEWQASLNYAERYEGDPAESMERESTPRSQISAWPCARKATKHTKCIETSKTRI